MKTNIKKSDLIWLGVLAILLLMLQSFEKPFFFFQEVNYLAQPYDVRGWAKAIIYGSSFALGLGAVLGLLLVNNRWLALGSMVYMGITYAVDFFVQYMGAYRGFSLEELVIAISQVHLITNLQAYLTEIIAAIGVAIVVTSFMYLVRKKSNCRLSNQVGFIWLSLATLSCYYAAEKVNTILLNGYPAPVKTIAIACAYTQLKDTNAQRLLHSNISPPIPSSPKNILWIIDESATGSYLSINGYNQETTPFLNEQLISNKYLVNFGEVNSISNCSNYSNLFMRVGMSPHFSYDTLYHLPSILSFAKNAGYKVLMLDAQITKGEMTNFLTPDEMGLIDQIHTLDRTILPQERDQALVKILLDLLQKPSSKPYFVIFIKFGCHWPYLLNFDPSNAVFKPIQPSTHTRMIPENKELIINTYLNSILFNVDFFFKDLLPGIDPHKNILFYTSDHGQGIIEGHNPRTHCSNQTDHIPRNEFSVPLLLYTSGADTIQVDGKYSQIQLFPSTLACLGYDSNNYGSCLWEEASNDRRSFITGTGQLYDFDQWNRIYK